MIVSALGAACLGLGWRDPEAGAVRLSLREALMIALEPLAVREPGALVGLISAYNYRTGDLGPDGYSREWGLLLRRPGGLVTVTYSVRGGRLAEMGSIMRSTVPSRGPAVGPFDGDGWLPIRDSTEVISLLNARGAGDFTTRTGGTLQQMVLERDLEGRLVWQVYYSRFGAAGDRPGRIPRLRATLDAASGEILTYQESVE